MAPPIRKNYGKAHSLEAALREFGKENEFKKLYCSEPSKKSLAPEISGKKIRSERLILPDQENL
jgi:hypothetical protein